jgi:hypothetical protein
MKCVCVMSYNIVSYFVEICGFLLIMIAQFHHDRTEILFKVEFNDHTPIKSTAKM